MFCVNLRNDARIVIVIAKKKSMLNTKQRLKQSVCLSATDRKELLG